MTSLNFKYALALLTAFREERVNQFEGMRGVLHVINNRLKAKQFGFANDVQTVVTGHNQFSSMVTAGDGQTVAFPDLKDEEFNKLMGIVDKVFTGEDEDPTNGALFYADLSSSKFYQNGWFSETILKNPQRFPPSAKIGTTTYYRQIS